MTSFPAESFPFPQNGMESNTDEAFSEQLQLDSKAASGDAQHKASAEKRRIRL